jgi:hypothetical protein
VSNDFTGYSQMVQRINVAANLGREPIREPGRQRWLTVEAQPMAGKTKILALSGRKGSGKSTLTKLLIYNGHLFFGNGSALHSAKPDTDGRGATFSLASGRALRVRAYAMADPLKRFCVDVLGLAEECVYGTEEQKNQKTHILWENLPHYPRILEGLRQQAQQEVDKERADAPLWERTFGDAVRGWKNMVENRVALRAPTGPMTGRQVQQHFGTDVVRAMYPDAWNRACLKAIEREAPDVAIVDDCRFADECEAVKGAGGVVARLQRNPNPGDAHTSESALDDYLGFNFLLEDGLGLRGTCDEFLVGLAWRGLIRTDWDPSRVLWPPYDEAFTVPSEQQRRFVGMDLAHPGGECTGYAVMESSP